MLDCFKLGIKHFPQSRPARNKWFVLDCFELDCFELGIKHFPHSMPARSNWLVLDCFDIGIKHFPHLSTYPTNQLRHAPKRVLALTC